MRQSAVCSKVAAVILKDGLKWYSLQSDFYPYLSSVLSRYQEAVDLDRVITSKWTEEETGMSVRDPGELLRMESGQG